MFHLKNKRAVSRVIHHVRQALMIDFVPHHIGLNHINRQEVIDHHQAALATALLSSNSDQLCVVIDGTYLTIQKSSNSKFQRRTYSVHKHKNLVKPMIITATVKFSKTLYRSSSVNSSFLFDHAFQPRILSQIDVLF